MTNNNTPTNNDLVSLEYTIPSFGEFAELYHDKIHALIFHIAETKGRFTIILTLRDRSEEFIYRNKININMGTETQRRILEEFGDDYERRNKELDPHWECLKEIVIDRNMESIETFKYVDFFNSGELSLSDIKIGHLGNYFKTYHESGKFDNEVQRHEYPILSAYFDTTENSQDGFISIPIAAFGTFDGVVHIIFTAEDKAVFEDQKTIKTLAKLISLAFDDMLLNWQPDLGDVRNILNMNIDVLQEGEHMKNNRFLTDIGLQRYYKHTAIYHKKRIEKSTELPSKLEKQQRIQAITTILIDSFAHNISAHSLTTLSVWLNELTAYLIDADGISTETLKQNPFIQHYRKYERQPRFINLSREYADLYKFLYEKAAFWNAISRQTNFAGQVLSLYDILWKDFIGNALYLGSIAYNEKVQQIHIGITFFDQETRDEQQPYISTKSIAKDEQGNTYNDILASISLVKPDLNPDYKEKSIFIQKGEHFERLSEKLKQISLFLPGGVVGKHAFLTILENEIRNIKHYKDDIDLMEKIRNEGLRLNISIHARAINSDKSDGTNETELCKIGVSLQLPTDIQSEILEERLQNLEGDILNEQTRPRLGGTFQDKICAAMLLKGSFAKVQDREEEVDQRYYPWVKSAVQPVYTKEKIEPRQEVVDFEISLRTYNEIKGKKTADEKSADFKIIFNDFIQKQTHQTAYVPDKVYYKKYIHVWFGAELYYVVADENLEWENIARFKIVVLLPESHYRYKKLKRMGVTRILKAEQKFTDTLSAYQMWLQIWNKGITCQVIDFFEGSDPTARIIYENNELVFFNNKSIKNRDKDDSSYEHYRTQCEQNHAKLTMAHGGKSSTEPNILNYRSYGVLRQQFCQGNDLKKANINGIDLCELYEVLQTRIVIFDNRLHQALSDDKRATYANKLYCSIHAEDKKAWEEAKKQNFHQLHYLVVHLSFIERMKDSNDEAYGEKGIQKFIEEQVLGQANVADLQDHFNLVITTGRGRIEWWDNIENANHQLINICTFRPLESLVNAIQDAKLINDDFDLKYNFVKVLMNS